MILASKTTLSNISNMTIYGDAAVVNAAVIRTSSNRVPCYATPGKRVAFKWVSVGSSCVIPRGEAAKMLARVGVDINEVEAA